MSKKTEKNTAPNTTWYSDRYVPAKTTEDIINHLVGEILTIVDASIGEERQNKAMKDLIKNKAAFAMDFWKDVFHWDGKNLFATLNTPEGNKAYKYNPDGTCEEMPLGNSLVDGIKIA